MAIRRAGTILTPICLVAALASAAIGGPSDRGARAAQQVASTGGCFEPSEPKAPPPAPWDYPEDHQPASLQPGGRLARGPELELASSPGQALLSSHDGLGQGWTVVLQEDFEGTFPGPGWQLAGNSEDYSVGRRECRRARGEYAAWSHGGGAIGSTAACSSPYPDNLEAYAIFGPFSLVGASAAELEIDYWAETQPDADFMLILLSTNAEDWNGWSLSGSTQGWKHDNLDLTTAAVPDGVLGQPEVWLALGLESDTSLGYEGAFFDNVILRARAGSPTPITPPATTTASPAPSETPVPEEWTTVLRESFEDQFPGPGWRIESTDERFRWGKRDCRAISGTFSAWAHGGGTVGETYTCGTLYPGDLETWLIYGPISFADVTQALVDLSIWATIQENEDPFRFMVSVDDRTFYGWVLSRSTAGWYTTVFDLRKAEVPGGVMGHPEVWLGFNFESDAGINFEGVHVDAIRLRVRHWHEAARLHLPYSANGS